MKMKKNNDAPLAPSTIGQEPGRFSSYGDLARHGKKALQEAGRGPQQIANYLSALNGWLKTNSLSRDAVVGEEFGKSFDTVFFRYQDLVRDRVSQRTFKDRAEQILWWQRSWQSLLKQDSLPKSFADALAIAFAQSGLTKAELCRRAGLRADTLSRWLSGEHLPEAASEPVVCEVERALDLKTGTLTRRLPMRRRSRYARGQDRTKPKGTRYGNRLRRNREALKHYALPATERLREQWLQLVRMKTDLARPRATARNTWRVKRLDRTGTRLHWSMLIDGQACVTGSVQYKQIASYLGFLALAKDKGGLGLSAEGLDTLAWMVRADYLKSYLKWLRRRADNVLHNGLFTLLDMVRSHLRPQTGFLWLHPELAETLPGGQHAPADGVDPDAAWRASCEAAHQNLLEFSRALKIEGKPRRSRDPRERIQGMLASSFPLKELLKIVRAVEHDPPPMAHERDYVVWIRDVLLLKILLNHPLRASHFSVMTFRGHDANLYQSQDGGWRLRFVPNDFKNEKGAANEDYDVSVHDSIGVWINRYLSEARPVLIGADDCDYVFLPSVVGNRGRRGMDATLDSEPTYIWNAENLSKRLHEVTSRYSHDGVGFGAHAIRHLIATDHLKRYPQDYARLAKMLNDNLVTVMREYVHLEASAGTLTIRSSIELAEQELDGDNAK